MLEFLHGERRMDFFGRYQSPFGYENGDNGIDSYGVDHSEFITQDELQYDLSQRLLYLYGGAEFVGAVQSPLQLFKGAKKIDNVLNAAVNTGVASAGYAENWKDFGNNLIANGIANGLGLAAEYLPVGRAFGVVGRKALTQGINSTTNELKNRLFDNNK